MDENNETNKIIMNEIKIKTENYEFHVTIEKIKSGDEYFTIYNKGEYYIRIKIDNNLKNDIHLQWNLCSDKELFYETNCNKIKHLNFYESCAINESFIKKTETIEMLFALLEYIKKQYGNNLKYFFEDDSKIHIIYILLFGETWYMKNIKAIPVSIDFLETLNIINNYLVNNKDKLSNFFEFNFHNNNSYENIISNKLFTIIHRFLSTHLCVDKNYFMERSVIKQSKYIKKNITKKILFDKIKKIYNLSNNSREFLYNLYKYFGIIIFVLIDYYKYYKYITYKFKKSLNFNSYMQIPTDYVNSFKVIKSIEIM